VLRRAERYTARTMKATERFLQGVLDDLEAHALLRDPSGGRQRAEATAAAAEHRVDFIDASSNDYLGLARCVVSRETLNALAGSQVGSGASRLIHGTRPEHEELERELASWVGLPRALSFSSGYSANVGLMAALGAPGSLLVSDALNHASIIDGCRLSKAEVKVVPHLDLEAVERALRESSVTTRWVVTESYFSMDGDGPDLRALAAICQKYEAGLVVDEAHALGVFGPEGAGRCAEAGLVPDVLVGTFGKAVGLNGAFVAGSERLRTFLWNRARSFVFSTAPSPLLARLAMLHVKQVRRADAERRRLQGLTSAFRDELRRRGQSVLEGSFGPIVPVLAGTNERALEAASRLRSEGVLTQAIRPPTVPPGTARLRVTVTAALAPDQVQRLASAVVNALEPGEAERPSSMARMASAAATSAPHSERTTSVRRVVLLGTGTGVGKTRVGAALARALRVRGQAVLGLKPVESGVSPGSVGEDALGLATAAGHPVPPGALFLREPLSPHLAAEREGVRLDVASLQEWVWREEASFRLAHPDGWLLVETAGGVFSPLAPSFTNFELGLSLGRARWILIAPDALGVLHELSATLEAMRARGRQPDLVVLSAAREPDLSTGTNAHELRRLGIATPSVVLDRNRDDTVEALVDQLLSGVPAT
jgi:8-amino-7-oxononanoate synthase